MKNMHTINTTATEATTIPSITCSLCCKPKRFFPFNIPGDVCGGFTVVSVVVCGLDVVILTVGVAVVGVTGDGLAGVGLRLVNLIDGSGLVGSITGLGVVSWIATMCEPELFPIGSGVVVNVFVKFCKTIFES